MTGDAGKGTGTPGFRILVVEDDAGIAGLIRLHLSRNGFDVSIETDGILAGKRLAEEPYDLLILDYRLTGMTAEDLVDGMEKAGRRVPFLIMTAMGDVRTAVTMMKKGARDYLYKDTDFLEFLPAVVRRVLEDMGTERKLQAAEKARAEMQACLFQRQKMEAVGVMAGGIAHDFNNLLTVILGTVQMARARTPPDAPVSELLKQADEAAMRGASLTRQLLLFSRGQEAQREVLALGPLLDKWVRLMRRLFEENIEVILEVEPALEPILADAGHLEQILMNLSLNARDAMPKGGRILLSADNVDVSAHECADSPLRPGRCVRLVISDTGTGMEKDTLEHVFEPFFTTKEKGKGTGLGLSVVYGIVQQHDGCIRVESEAGRGTTFTILFPASQKKEAAPLTAPVEFEDLRGTGQTVFFVEDDIPLARFYTKALEEHGYRVKMARTAQEAEALFKEDKEKSRLLLCDVVLPDENGFDLAERLLKSDPSLRVLLTSGYLDDKSRENLIKNKGFRFLPKPYTLPKILEAMKRSLSETP